MASLTTLSGLGVAVQGALRQLFAWPILVLGQDVNGNFKSVIVGADGSLASNSQLPYGADRVDYTNCNAGPATATFYKLGTAIKVRTWTYTDPTSTTGKITQVADTNPA